jgi:hypothetical protein
MITPEWVEWLSHATRGTPIEYGECEHCTALVTSQDDEGDWGCEAGTGCARPRAQKPDTAIVRARRGTYALPRHPSVSRQLVRARVASGWPTDRAAITPARRRVE